MTARSEDVSKLYVDQSAQLERQVRRKVGPVVARDIVHDVFLRLWEKATEQTGNPNAFLNRCARNASIDYLRSEKVRAAFFGGLTQDQYAAPVASPHDILVARQGIGTIDAALAALPKQTRHVFLLNRVHGKTFVEIAPAMGISERMVAKHMARAVAACEVAMADGFALPGGNAVSGRMSER